MISFVGPDPMGAEPRFTYGQLFLWDGIDLITATIAIFAVPELIALAMERGKAAGSGNPPMRYSFGDVWFGCVDVFRHWGLTIRTSIIGAFIGLIPGLGGDVASWICYGHAVQSSKNPERFGKGAVEGVIGPETANNSKEGGALLPTLYFGIPGSSGMAILLGAFVMLGIQPGPGMATGGQSIVWALVWTLAIANIAAVILLLACAPWLSRIASIRPSLLLPFVIVLSMLGIYLSASAWQNFGIMAAFGLFGYFLKKQDWPRPPFMVGLVLGPIAESSLHKALALWGIEFVFRPLSLVMIVLIAATIIYHAVKRRQARRAS
jgi:TctA family transporter